MTLKRDGRLKTFAAQKHGLSFAKALYRPLYRMDTDPSREGSHGNLHWTARFHWRAWRCAGHAAMRGRSAAIGAASDRFSQWRVASEGPLGRVSTWVE